MCCRSSSSSLGSEIHITNSDNHNWPCTDPPSRQCWIRTCHSCVNRCPLGPRVFLGRTRLQYITALSFFALTLSGYWLMSTPDVTPFANPTTFAEYSKLVDHHRHPIDELIDDAQRLHEIMLSVTSHDLGTAAARYRQRRGRHPPPGFDAWFKYAQDHNATVVESFFDRIEKDIAPSWALDPRQTALRASTWLNVVRVRGGKAKGEGPIKKWAPPWQQLWADLVNEAAPFLPDVDMPFNYYDESRLLVPWESMERLMRTEKEGRSMPAPADMSSKFSGLDDVDKIRGQTDMYEPEWVTKDFWDAIRATCPPTSPSRNVEQYRVLWERPQFPADDQNFQYKGATSATSRPPQIYVPSLTFEDCTRPWSSPRPWWPRRSSSPCLEGASYSQTTRFSFPAPCTWPSRLTSV